MRDGLACRGGVSGIIPSTAPEMARRWPAVAFDGAPDIQLRRLRSVMPVLPLAKAAGGRAMGAARPVVPLLLLPLPPPPIPVVGGGGGNGGNGGAEPRDAERCIATDGTVPGIGGGRGAEEEAPLATPALPRWSCRSCRVGLTLALGTRLRMVPAAARGRDRWPDADGQRGRVRRWAAVLLWSA